MASLFGRTRTSRFFTFTLLLLVSVPGCSGGGGGSSSGSNPSVGGYGPLGTGSSSNSQPQPNTPDFVEIHNSLLSESFAARLQDLDADGAPDVSTDFLSQRLVYYRGAGMASFHQVGPEPDVGYQVILAERATPYPQPVDMDGDTSLEYAVLRHDTVLKTAEVSFYAAATHSLKTSSHSFQNVASIDGLTADLNGDTVYELILHLRFENGLEQVWVLEGSASHDILFDTGLVTDVLEIGAEDIDGDSRHELRLSVASPLANTPGSFSYAIHWYDGLHWTVRSQVGPSLSRLFPVLHEVAHGSMGPIDTDSDAGLEFLLIEIHPVSHSAMLSYYDAFSGHEKFVHPWFIDDIWSIDAELADLDGDARHETVLKIDYASGGQRCVVLNGSINHEIIYDTGMLTDNLTVDLVDVYRDGEPELVLTLRQTASNGGLQSSLHVLEALHSNHLTPRLDIGPLTGVEARLVAPEIEPGLRAVVEMDGLAGDELFVIETAPQTGLSHAKLYDIFNGTVKRAHTLYDVQNASGLIADLNMDGEYEAVLDLDLRNGEQQLLVLRAP